MLDHYQAMLSHYGVETGARVARKHLGWYAAGSTDAAGFRRATLTEPDPGRVMAAIRAFYDRAAERQAA